MSSRVNAFVILAAAALNVGIAVANQPAPFNAGTAVLCFGVFLMLKDGRS